AGPCSTCQPMRSGWMWIGTASTCRPNPSQSPTGSAARPMAATVGAGRPGWTHAVAGRTGARPESDHPHATRWKRNTKVALKPGFEDVRERILPWHGWRVVRISFTSWRIGPPLFPACLAFRGALDRDAEQPL